MIFIYWSETETKKRSLTFWFWQRILKKNTKFGHTVGLTNNTPSSISLLVVKTHPELHILTNWSRVVKT